VPDYERPNYERFSGERKDAEIQQRQGKDEDERDNIKGPRLCWKMNFIEGSAID
jgi:hypothetical protein